MTELNLKSLIKIHEDYKDKVRAEGEQALKNEFKAFFEAHPEVAAIRWAQYTPWFNDGDACVFRIDEPQFRLKEPEADAELAESVVDPNILSEDENEDEYEDEDDEFDYDEWIEQWDMPLAKVNPELSEAINDLSRALQDADDVLQAVFDDHSQITVTPEDITIDSYDHD